VENCGFPLKPVTPSEPFEVLIYFHLLGILHSLFFQKSQVLAIISLFEILASFPTKCEQQHGMTVVVVVLQDYRMIGAAFISIGLTAFSCPVVNVGH